MRRFIPVGLIPVVFALACSSESLTNPRTTSADRTAGSGVRVTVTDLGTLPGGGDYSGATAVNDEGETVGYAATAQGFIHAVRWDQRGRIHDLGAIAGPANPDSFGGTGYEYSTANGVNHDGIVVGGGSVASGSQHALRWKDGRIKDLGALPGADYSYATAINDEGDIVGQSSASDGSTHAVLWRGGEHLVDLGILPGGYLSAAFGINARGVVAGYSATSTGTYHAVTWKRGQITDLGSFGSLSCPPGAVAAPAAVAADTGGGGGGGGPGCGPDASFGSAINDAGAVVGNSADASGYWHPFLWKNGTMTDLGVLPNSYYSNATGINNAGVVVGFSDSFAVEWLPNGAIVELPALAGGYYAFATGISGMGRVVGASVNAVGSIHAAMWVTHSDRSN